MTHRGMAKQAKQWALTALLLGMAGCAGMVDTPTHVRPDPVPKTSWSVDLASQHGIDRHWWEGFEDQTLNALVARAIESNLDLRLLAARTELAGRQIGQARALRLPVMNVGTRTDSTNLSGEGGTSTSTRYGVGGDLIWELDVWGKAAKGVAAQDAAYRASQADWRAGYLVLVGSVAESYFQIRQLDRQRAQQQHAFEQNEQILALYQRLHARGLTPRTRVTQQEAELHSLRIGLQELERARALTVNALAALLGEAPGNFRLPETTGHGPVEIPAVPAGLPAELLSRRPDIVAAEYRLMQQVNLEGQARLARLPTVGITGLGGSASFDLSNLLKTWTAGLSSVLQFPVFDPNVRALIQVSEAQVDVAEQQYRATVMQAFEEVESILINLESRRKQRVDLLARRDKLEDVNRLNRRQLELGLLSHLEVLEQERSLLAAEQELIANEWQIAALTVSLFKAVGGGWPAEDPGTSV